jgi:predicted Rossmann fold flavoprotein
MPKIEEENPHQLPFSPIKNYDILRIMQNRYDIAVIGAGASGLMAAAEASSRGAKVVVVEKMPIAGKKLFVTGNGRCNITNISLAKPDIKGIFGGNGVFLNSAFKQFPFDSVIEFFENNGVKIRKEKDGRMFPVSDKASDVLEMFMNIGEMNGVKFLYSTPVKKFNMSKDNNKRIISLQTGESQNDCIEAEQFIMACGGKSFPVTGSTGDGYQWAKDTGHKITDIYPALVPIKIKEPWIKKLQGLTLDRVGIKFLSDGKILYSSEGSILFTHFGLSGPVILNSSGIAAKAGSGHEVKIRLNLINQEKEDYINEFISDLMADNSKKTMINMLRSILPERAALITAEVSGIDIHKKTAILNKNERRILKEVLTKFEMTYDGTLGFSQAMATGGGIDLKDVDPATMRSKLVENLYFAGEILDLDAPTGGFNLHMCWLTGFVAGKSASEAILVR